MGGHEDDMEKRITLLKVNLKRSKSLGPYDANTYVKNNPPANGFCFSWIFYLSMEWVPNADHSVEWKLQFNCIKWLAI